MKKKKSLLNLDNKKRVTLGKYVSKDVTGFKVEKLSDGTLVLYPLSHLVSEEQEIYQTSKFQKSLQRALLEIKKSITTQITVDFWQKDVSKDLYYTTEFLKALQKIINKDEMEIFNKLQDFLINPKESSFIVLENKRTPKNEDINLTKLGIEKKVLWAITEEKIVLLTIL